LEKPHMTCDRRQEGLGRQLLVVISATIKTILALI